MKKMFKITFMFLTLLAFMIPLTVEGWSSTGKECPDYSANECPNYTLLDEHGKPQTDEDGNYCTQIIDYTNGNKCDFAPDSVQPCYAFNNSERYPEREASCPTDRCVYNTGADSDTFAEYCLPQKQYLTCEDLGKFTTYGGANICDGDFLASTCAGDEFGICYTFEKYSNDPNEMIKCEDYTYDGCPVGEKDYLGNTCDKNDETEKCYSLMDQTKANVNATNKKTYGQDNYSRVKKSKKPFKCSDVKYLTGAWTLIRIAAPFIVILFGSLDFIKAVMASDEKKMKETKGKFIKRVIAFVLLILLPFVVQFVFSVMGTFGSENMCLVKCIVTNNTAEEECD